MLADRGCDEAVRAATEALLLPLSGMRKRIKAGVKRAIDEYIERRQRPGGQERGADAEAGMYAGPKAYHVAHT